MKKSFILTAMSALLSFGSIQAEKYVGGDISELPTMENAKARYYDKDGKSISDLITYSYDQGMNAMRVRLFVDPETFIATNAGDPYACQSLEYILPVCKRIKEAGHSLLLDFHYSDSWADPVKQYTPAKWADLDDEALCTTIYDYTKEVLQKLIEENATPDFIQTGNEISYGMCWGPYGASSSSLKKVYFNGTNTATNTANMERFANLLNSATKACREICPDAKIILHSERTGQPNVLLNFYDWAKNTGIDYDIIGLSYYFYYHGRLSALEDALYSIENRNYGKDIWIVETGAPINWSVGDSDKQFYEATDAGQNLFATELLATLDKHPAVNGLFWWEMDYNAYWTSLENWYNASFFDNKTGKATSAFYTIAGWASTDNSGDNEEDKPQNYPDYYLLYNHGGDWEVPGTVFINNQNGTYTLTDVEMYQNGSEYAWFAITSANSTNWDVINAFRYGPVQNDQDPLLAETSDVALNINSWQIVAGTYNLTFDAENMTLVVKIAGEENEEEEKGEEDGEDDPSTAIDNINVDSQNIYFDLQGRRIINPKNGIYIKVSGNKHQKVIIK